MYAINSETHNKIIKQIVIDKKPTKEIKWNYKNIQLTHKNAKNRKRRIKMGK